MDADKHRKIKMAPGVQIKRKDASGMGADKRRLLFNRLKLFGRYG